MPTQNTDIPSPEQIQAWRELMFLDPFFRMFSDLKKDPNAKFKAEHNGDLMQINFYTNKPYLFQEYMEVKNDAEIKEADRLYLEAHPEKKDVEPTYQRYGMSFTFENGVHMGRFIRLGSVYNPDLKAVVCKDEETPQPIVISKL